MAKRVVRGTPLRWATLLIWTIAGTACGSDQQSSGSTVAHPTAPTSMARDVRPGTLHRTVANPISTGAALRTPEMSLAVAVDTTAAPRPFPPRDETFAFRMALEQIYRTEFGRSAALTFFDVEGDLVWTQEYMRYRVYGCDHLDAVQKVFEQIDRGVIAPVCGDIPGSAVRFPPFADTSDFRRWLDAKYRDDLGRTPSPAYVDAEGAIVWTETYLRYRVFACDDATARAAVRTVMFGGAAPPYCVATPAPREFLGQWSGIIAMAEPRPFSMELTGQRGREYFGSYRDIAVGSVGLTWDGEDGIEMFVYFGDGSATFRGQFIAPDRVRGTMKYDKISTVFGFDMMRR
jgi:hypothetical protein